MDDHTPPSLILPSEIQHIIGEIDAVIYPVQGATSQVMVIHGRRGIFVAKRATQRRYRAWLQREYVVLQSLAATALPVPHVYTYVHSAHQDRESWLLMSYLPGETLRTVLRTESDSHARHNLLTSFGRLLRSVHGCTLPAAFRQDESWLDRTLAQAAFALQHEEVDGTPELLVRLQRYRLALIQETLIHGDCTLDNMLVQNGICRGIVDWAAGGQGDPRHDLALATQPEREAFQYPSDYDAFYQGYAGERLTEAESDYFLGLDEFF